MLKRLVIVGNGMVGIRLVEELLRLSPNRFEIRIFGDEPDPAYDRIKLSPVLGGEKEIRQIFLHEPQWYEENNIKVYCGKEIGFIDRIQKRVVYSEKESFKEQGFTEHSFKEESFKEESFHYDYLVLATGSHPILLNIPGKELKGVLAFRTLSDVRYLLDSAKSKKNAVIIGGGLLGLEAAYGLSKQGLSITVIQKADVLMERQLDSKSGEMLKSYLAKKGIRTLISATTREIIGNSDHEVSGVSLEDGTILPADLVVMALGIRPRAELAKNSGLACNRGVLVDDNLQSSDPNIFAVGECAEHSGVTYGLVAPLFEMARTCAQTLIYRAYGSGSAQDIKLFQGTVLFAKLKVTGVEVYSAGDHLGGPTSENITLHDPAAGMYRKIVLEQNQIKGLVMYGDISDANWYFQQLKQGKDISKIRDRIGFGQQVAESGLGGAKSSPAAGFTDEMEVCGCNGVCKGRIVDSIRKNKLSTLEDVRMHTKASSSCGSCTEIVRDIISMTLGPDVVQSLPEKKAFCKCTHLSHEEVRAQVREKNILSITGFMKQANWATEDGCNKCRPALNYYLLCEYPDRYQDDSQSRLVNERVHANIQRNGTYSVVPRMWGGITNPKELRAIADVADKFNIPTVKVTGGQRIDLLGVAKDDLPAVWKDLNSAGMVSGHAYAKGVRTVKTCVGSEWCRFGVQDSTQLGIRMEEMTWGSWAPHKIKMGVSGCPRNCAEATIKDLGVVAVDSGWEIHVAGNGGIKVRAAQFLCKVSTQEEVLEYCGAFLQLYRKEGHYLERTVHWVDRVGLEAIRKRLVDDEKNRNALYREFIKSQEHFQTDPWQERSKFAISTSPPSYL